MGRGALATADWCPQSFFGNAACLQGAGFTLMALPEVCSPHKLTNRCEMRSWQLPGLGASHPHRAGGVPAQKAEGSFNPGAQGWLR